MDRLTEKHYKAEDGYYLKCSGLPVCCGECGECDEINEVVDRLAAYEDTGIEPEEIAHNLEVLNMFAEATKGIPLNRIRELSKAEREGRMLVMPCKVGCTVWMVVTKRPKINAPEFSFVKRSRLTFLNMERCLADFGKTVFLTREEAEAALEAQKGTENEV